MKALVFDAPIPTYVATMVAGRLSDSFYVGPRATTRYGDVNEPPLPTSRWVRLRTILGGICGSDLSIVTLNTSPSTSPFSSFPFVLGHENVAEVVEVGSSVRGVTRGARVTVNPLLCCEPRGIAPPCDGCAAGQHPRCTRFTDGDVPAGLMIGLTRSTGGSWGEQFVAHESQLVPVPEAVSNESAVLVEPFACCVHAVRSSLPASGDRVLVIGAGSIGLLTVAALRALSPDVDVTVLARHAFQGEHARSLGASTIVRARGDYVHELAEAARARLLRPIIGGPVAVGGFDGCFVCIGARRGIEDALRFTRAGGTAVLLGAASKLDGVDWTPLWLKELTVRGSLTYGTHGHASPHAHAFDEAADLIASGRVKIEPLLTHTFPLADYRRALATAMDKGAARSVKVAFSF
ncbi:MAG: alcohol dehydrogenase catalytic domain-containing protein [Gemmatimonadota bacterium]|nr:alcohol dehydrogenase catalytic domain-containing protein [Gemmatimonadota bacterium]